MSAVDVVVDNVPPREQTYKEIIAADQEQTAARATQLAILPEKARQEIVVASQYSSYFPNPITDQFMETYILSKLEFPTTGSKLAQSITELNVRVDNLFNDAYTYKKAELEAGKLEIEMRILDRKRSKTEDELDAALIENEIELKALEQRNKAYSLNKIKLAAMARFNEAMGWKKCVEKYMAEAGVTSLEQFDFNSVRMQEMQAKIRRWGELHVQGALELTPSKFQAIDANEDAFKAGQQDGQQKTIEYQRAVAQQQRLLGPQSAIRS